MKRTWPIALLVTLLFVRPAPAAQKTPPPPPARAKCPVCGMFVAKYPDWTGAIVFRDAATVYFDGPKDLFAYYLDPGKYDPARKRSGIAALFVKDYYSLAFIDGRQAFYVIGSDVNGPMGKELIPFARRDDADGFLRDHRGKRVVRPGEITPALLKELE
ncbi:MAG TPA: nitrous oxide reductase accessory protein NosL [Geobacteraceae bacterium]